MIIFKVLNNRKSYYLIFFKNNICKWWCCRFNVSKLFIVNEMGSKSDNFGYRFLFSNCLMKYICYV